MGEEKWAKLSELEVLEEESYNSLKRRKFMKQGHIQNEDVLRKALYEEREFIIPCADEKDAHSKRVSLNHAKGRMSVSEQKKVGVQKIEYDEGKWGIRVYYIPKQEIFEIVNGELIVAEIGLSEESQYMLDLMIKDKVSEEEIITTLINQGEKEANIKEALITHRVFEVPEQKVETTSFIPQGTEKREKLKLDIDMTSEERELKAVKDAKAFESRVEKELEQLNKERRI